MFCVIRGLSVRGSSTARLFRKEAQHLTKMREKPLLQRGSDGEVFAEHLTKHLTKHLTTGESLTASPKGRGLSGKYKDALRPQQLIRPQKKWGFKIPASQQPNFKFG